MHAVPSTLVAQFTQLGPHPWGRVSAPHEPPTQHCAAPTGQEPHAPPPVPHAMLVSPATQVPPTLVGDE
jgi:hypothetical protein